MANTDLCFLNVTELAPLLRARKLSPVELVHALLERNELPRSKLRGIEPQNQKTLKQLKLHVLTMELLVGLWTLYTALVFDISANDIFIPVATDCTDEVAFGPEFSTPELLLDRRHTGKNFAGGKTFDDFHDLRWAIRWYRLYKKMDMVVVGPNL